MERLRRYRFFTIALAVMCGGVFFFSEIVHLQHAHAIQHNEQGVHLNTSSKETIGEHHSCVFCDGLVRSLGAEKNNLSARPVFNELIRFDHSEVFLSIFTTSPLGPRAPPLS